jgi:hypothetical protein
VAGVGSRHSLFGMTDASDIGDHSLSQRQLIRSGPGCETVVIYFYTVGT